MSLLRLILLLGVLATPPGACAELLTFLKISGIPGESMVPGYSGWIDVTSYSQRSTATITREPSGFSAEKVSAGEVILGLNRLQAQPLILTRLTTQSSSTIELQMIQNSPGGSFTLQTLVYQGAYFTQASDQFDANSGKRSSELRFLYENSSWTVYTPNASGGVNASSTIDLDIVTNLSQLTLSNPNDFDSDGMPNDWETANGLNPNSSADKLLDPDGDRFVNLFEYLADTSPTNANEYLEIEQIQDTGPSAARFTWASEPGITYLLQSNSNLTSGWVTEATVPSSGTGTTSTTLTNTVSGSTFFRVSIEEAL